MRLIDADALPREEFQIVNEWHMHKNVGVVFAEDIDRAPTVDDVAPVRHGHWKQDKGGKVSANCSICDSWMPFRILPYCPYCGARMDEEVD